MRSQRGWLTRDIAPHWRDRPISAVVGRNSAAVSPGSIKARITSGSSWRSSRKRLGELLDMLVLRSVVHETRETLAAVRPAAPGPSGPPQGAACLERVSKSRCEFGTAPLTCFSGFHVKPGIQRRWISGSTPSYSSRSGTLIFEVRHHSASRSRSCMLRVDSKGRFIAFCGVVQPWRRVRGRGCRSRNSALERRAWSRKSLLCGRPDLRRVSPWLWKLVAHGAIARARSKAVSAEAKSSTRR